MRYIILIFFLGVSHTPLFAKEIQTNKKRCAGYPEVSTYLTVDRDKCLGLVLSAQDIKWEKPRRFLFLDDTKIVVTDMGGWKNRNSGKVLEIDLNTKISRTLYSGGDWTHGLGKDSKGRILFGDTDQVLRMEHDGEIRVLISGLPKKGSHPLSHFILLPNDDLVLNIGAPSNDCSLEREGTYCEQRDREGELRLYNYKGRKDGYGKNYKVLARGLRNSMALLYNENLDLLYQAENNMDQLGIFEEFNEIPLRNWFKVEDYGWPFCHSMGEEYIFPRVKGKSPLREGTFKNFCSQRASQPLFLIPAHSSPLDMMYYNGDAHPELNGKILMSWHGHRRSSEFSLVSYETDLDKAPLFERHGLNNFTPLVHGLGDSPKDKLRPVGLGTDSKGNIYFMDDVNKALLIYGHASQSRAPRPVPNTANYQEVVNKYISGLDSTALLEWDSRYSQFRRVQSCTTCHGESLFPENSKAALNNFLMNAWFDFEGLPSNMNFFKRTSKLSAKPMPPAPEKAFGQEHPEVYRLLLDWARRNL